MNTVLEIVIVCSYKSIPEIPWIIGKNLITYVESKGLQVLYHEYGCGTGISLTERMYLPDTGNKLCYMLYWLSHIKFRIGEGFLLAEVIVESITDTVKCSIEYSLTVITIPMYNQEKELYKFRYPRLTNVILLLYTSWNLLKSWSKCLNSNYSLIFQLV